jgi:hypothetical protein
VTVLKTMSDDSDWKLKMSLGKVAVVHLNSPTEFTAWHLALRRVVAGYNMVPNLMYSVPENKYTSLKDVLKAKGKVKKEPTAETKDLDPLRPEESAMKSVAVDLTGEDLAVEPVSQELRTLMESLGVSPNMDEFFSSTTRFVIATSGKAETDKEVYFRQEIWTWMDSSLSHGTYKWVARTIKPVYDIHALYTKVVSLANKATCISHALEFKKIFTMPVSSDIFQYHADLIQQMKVVGQQGASLGIDAVIPSWMEQSMLLIAAWQHPHYRKIALEFTMKDTKVSIETLVKELQKQQLLTSHLNQAGGKADRGGRNRDSDAQVRQATGTRDPDAQVTMASPPSQRACFQFLKKGSCSRGDSCSFSHDRKEERAPPAGGVARSASKKGQHARAASRGGGERKRDKSTKSKGRKANTSQSSGPSAVDLCKKCGSAKHPGSECTFSGTCNYCSKEGHKEVVCRKKIADTGASAKAAVTIQDDGVEIRATSAPKHVSQAGPGWDFLVQNYEKLRHGMELPRFPTPGDASQSVSFQAEGTQPSMICQNDLCVSESKSDIGLTAFARLRGPSQAPSQLHDFTMAKVVETPLCENFLNPCAVASGDRDPDAAARVLIAGDTTDQSLVFDYESQNTTPVVCGFRCQPRPLQAISLGSWSGEAYHSSYW